MFLNVCGMLGLSHDEMYFGDIDYIHHRFIGWSMLHKFKRIEDWKRSRLVAYVVAKSLGATKAKSENDFMKIDEGVVKKSKLSKEDIERLKAL